jgi:hypothetical protein
VSYRRYISEGIPQASLADVQVLPEVREEPDDSHMEVEESVEISSTNPLVAETASVVPEPATESQTQNVSIIQAEDDLVDLDPPPPTENPIQDEANGSVAEFKEAFESPINEPSAADTSSVVVSEPATVVHENVYIENSGIAQAEEDSVAPSLTDNPVQEEADRTLVEFKESVENSSTAEPSVTEITSVVSELTTVPEELQIENDSSTEAHLVDVPALTKAVAPVAESKEAVENPSAPEPSVAEIASVVSEPAAVEEPHIDNVSIPQPEDLVDPPPPTEPSVTEIASVVSEPATVVPEEPQIDNDSIIQVQEYLVDPSPSTGHAIQEADTLVPKEAVDESSTAEPSLVETVLLVSEPAIAVPEELQTQNVGIIQAEEDLVVDPPPPTENPIQEGVDAPVTEFKETTEGSSADESSVADTSLVVFSEPATVAHHESVQIKDGAIAQAEDLVGPPPTENPIQEEADPVMESKEAVESLSAAESSATETAPVLSEPATVVPEEPQIDHDSIAQVEEGLVDPPPLTENPIQEEAVAPVTEFNEAVENSSTAHQSEVASVVPKELQIAQAAEDLVDPLPPSENPIQEEADPPVAEFEKEIESSSTDKLSVADTSLVVVSEPATVVHEGVQIENGGIAQAEDLVDPPSSTDNLIQEEVVAPVAEFKEVAENPSTPEPKAAEVASVVSEPAAKVPEELQLDDIAAQAAKDLVDPPAPIEPVTEIASVVSEPATVPELQIENGNITQAEADLVDFPPPTGNPIQIEADAIVVEIKEAVENACTTEPSVAEMVSVVSESAAAVPEEPQIDNDGIAQAEKDSLPSLSTENPTEEEAIAPVTEFNPFENSSTGEPSVAQIVSVVSELATVVSEELQVENNNVIQAEEDLVDPPLPTDTAEATFVKSKEAVENFSTDEPPVTEVASVVSEPTTVVPEIDNDNISQAEEHLVDQTESSVTAIASIASEPVTVVSEGPQIDNDSIIQVEPPPPSTNPIQEEAVPVAEFIVDNSSAVEPSVAETASVASNPTVVPEELQTRKVSITQEELSVDPPPPTENTIQREVVAPEAVENPSAPEPSAAEKPSVVSEPAVVTLEEPQIDNVNFPQAEDLVDPLPPTEPSVAGIASVVSESATVIPEKSLIENDSIAQAEEDLIHPPSTDNPTQEEAVAPVAEFKEAVEVSSTAEPSVTEIASEPLTEDFSFHNDSVAPAEGGLIDPSSLQTVETEHIDENTESQGKAAILETTLSKIETQPFDETETHVLNGNGHSITTQEAIRTYGMFILCMTSQVLIEEAVAPEAVENPSALEPSVAEKTSVVSEPAVVTLEEPQIDNVQVEDLVDPPPTEPSVTEIASVVSEPATAVPEESLNNIAQAEEDSVHPPSTDPTQEEAVAPVAESKEAVEISSTAEPSVTEIASEPSTEIPEDLSIDPPLQTVETEHINEGTEGQGVSNGNGDSITPQEAIEPHGMFFILCITGQVLTEPLEGSEASSGLSSFSQTS